jgi:hypothetical protein
VSAVEWLPVIVARLVLTGLTGLNLSGVTPP